LLALFLVLALSSDGGGVVVVTAAPPVDAARLAETLRTYLDDSKVEVRVAPAVAPGELRAELAGLRATGVDLRAIAAVQVSQTDARTLEVQLVDLVTDKTLVASLPPVAHEADRYRVLALKIQALLRSALYEAVATSTASPTVARLVAPPPPAPRRTVLFWDTAYALVAFPLDGLLLQGVLVRGSWSPRPWFALGFASRALVPAQLQHQDVAVSVVRIPLALTADLRLEGRRFGGGVGLVTELAAERVTARSEGTVLRSRTLVVPAVGLEGEGRVQLARSAALFVRCAGLGVLFADRYTVRGVPVVDPSRWQLGLDAGLSLGIW
jgi:hypothetical protein